MAAEQITPSACLEIQQSAAPTAVEVAAVRRHVFERDCAVNLDDLSVKEKIEFFEWDKQGRGGKKVAAFEECFLDPEYSATALTHKFLEENPQESERQGFRTRVLIRMMLFKALHLHYDPDTGEVTDDPNFSFRYCDLLSTPAVRFANKHIAAVNGSSLGGRITGTHVTEATLGLWIRACGISLSSKRPRSGQGLTSTILKKEKDKPLTTAKNTRKPIYHVDLGKMSHLLGVIERRTKNGTLPGTVAAQKYLESQAQIEATFEMAEREVGGASSDEEIGPAPVASTLPTLDEPPAYLTDMANQPPDAIYENLPQPMDQLPPDDPNWFEQMFDKYKSVQ